MNPARRFDDRTFLPRLFDPETIAPSAEPAGPRLSPDLRISELFEEWFVPIVLTAQKNAKPGTVASYRESIGYWVRLTGDPTIRQLDGDEIFASKFLTGLRTETFKRGPLSEPRPLSKSTIAKHVIQVNAVIERIGPTRDRRRPCKELIDEIPLLSARKPRSTPKDPIELVEARRVYAQCRAMTTPARWTIAATRWQALIGTLYYVGLRIGTALALRREWLAAKGTEHWLTIPGDVVKRDKPLRKFVRRELAELLLGLPEGELFPAMRVDYARDRHERLQQLAGIPESRWFGFHAWRRTHGVQMALCGAKLGMRAAQWSLDHDDAETTRDHYVDIDRELIERLPPLAADRPEDPNQRTLF